jgi:hypothetical protein
MVRNSDRFGFKFILLSFLLFPIDMWALDHQGNFKKKNASFLSWFWYRMMWIFAEQDASTSIDKVIQDELKEHVYLRFLFEMKKTKEKDFFIYFKKIFFLELMD